MFPEGGRSTGETVGEFKSGLYYLAKKRPELELIPVFINNDGNLFAKRSKTGGGSPLFVNYKRIAIENELIIPPDGIAIEKWNPVPQSQFGYHCAPESRLTDRKWRGAEVKNDRDPLAYESFNRVAVIQIVAKIFVCPDILAYRDSYFLPK